MKDKVYGLLALISVAVAGYFFYAYVHQGDAAESASVLPFVGVVVFILVALGFGALFLSGRVNKTEDIHITE